jgi:hypothetical protein
MDENPTRFTRFPVSQRGYPQAYLAYVKVCNDALLRYFSTSSTPRMMTTPQSPAIGDLVRVSMYSFITGTVTDWDGKVTGRVNDTMVVVTDDDEGRDYVIPLRHIHVHSSETIAGV